MIGVAFAFSELDIEILEIGTYVFFKAHTLLQCKFLISAYLKRESEVKCLI